ncbi:MAG TPA: hypothetical protein VF039_13250 [Longimicrobiales bacterium]
MEAMATRDERTVAVENASFRYAYLALSYGLLLVVAYRSFALGEQSWDLLGLVLLGGGIATAYQGRRRVLVSRWYVLAAVGLAIALVLALVLSRS